MTLRIKFNRIIPKENNKIIQQHQNMNSQTCGFSGKIEFDNLNVYQGF